MDLSNVHVVRELLQQHGLRPKHKLGQNFLVNRSVLSAIVDGVGAGKDDLVIEVGPGVGTLTRELAAVAGRVLAVELDRELLPVLSKTLEPFPNAEVLHADVMQVDLNALIEAKRISGGVHVAANLPYYITTPILMRLLEERLPLGRIVVMVQKEVADRMVARPSTKAYGALSVAVQYYTRPEVIARVARGSFLPPPEVESSVVRLEVREQPPVDARPSTFFRVVKAAFGQRRKTLNNALGLLGLKKEAVAEILQACGVDGGRRGETLSLQEFAAISRGVQVLEADTVGSES